MHKKNTTIFTKKNQKEERGAATTTLVLIGLAVSAIGGYALTHNLPSGIENVLSALLLWIIEIFTRLAEFLCLLATKLFDESLSWLFKKITSDSTFVSAWGAVRDLSNMLIVLGFVIVGIATAMRFRDYEAKKLLPGLIGIAILINFSGLFCGLIIDGANITATSLIATSGGGGGANGVAASQIGARYYNLEHNFAQLAMDAVKQGADQEGNLKRFGVALEVMFIFIITAATFFFMAALYIARYAVLAFLFILSPLAFVCKVFPLKQAQKVWSDWWENFIKWAFIGVGGSFALWVSSMLVASVASGGQITFERMTLIMIFLIVGFQLIKKSSGIGASAVVGFAGGALGLAAGAVMGGGKGLAQIADRKFLGGRGSAIGQAVKNKYGRAMENVGLRREGTTASANSKQVDDEASLLSKTYTAAKATGDKAGMQRIRDLAINGKGARGAAAMKVLAEAKDLGDTFGNKETNLQTIANRMTYAEASGATGIREKAEKLDPRLKAYNPKVRTELLDPRAQVAAGFAKASIADIREFSEDTLKSRAFIDNTPGKKISKAAQEMSAAKIEAIQTHITTLQADMKKYKTSDPEQYKKLKKTLAEVVSL